MKAAAARHPKMLALASELELDLPTAIGTLELLWIFTSEFADDGAIGRRSDGAIEAACFWSGPSGKLVQALVAVGFVDQRPPPERLVVHDWMDHCPAYVRRRLARAADRAGDGPSVSRQPSVSDGNRSDPPRQGKARQGKARPTQPTTGGGRFAMPDPMPSEALEKLANWGDAAGHGQPQIALAVRAVRAWHQAEGSAIASRHRTLRGWIQTVQNSLTKGWWSDYAPPVSEAPAPAPGATNSEGWQKDRAALQAVVDSEAAERARRFPRQSVGELLRDQTGEEVVYPAALNEGASATRVPTCDECGHEFDMEGRCACSDPA